MKRAGMILALMMTLVFTGCSLHGDSVDETEKKVEEKKPTIILKEKEEIEEPIIYGLGERAVVRNDYAVTILHVDETEYRLPWNEDQENVVVEVLFENLTMDENHDIYNNEWGMITGFNLSIDNGSPYPPTVLYDVYRTSFTPAGAKSLHKLIFKSPAHTEVAKFTFADYKQDNLKFEVERGKRIEADLDGELPKPEIVYGKAEPIVLAKAAKDYTVTVNSVKKVDIDRPDPDFTTGADYEVELEFSNVDLDKFYRRNFQLTLIDEHGNTGYLDYYKGYTEENEDGDGVRVSLVFSANTDSEKLMLHYTDSFLNRDEAFYIVIDEIG